VILDNTNKHGKRYSLKLIENSEFGDFPISGVFSAFYAKVALAEKETEE